MVHTVRRDFLDTVSSSLRPPLPPCARRSRRLRPSLQRSWREHHISVEGARDRTYGATNVTYEKAALLRLSNDQYVAQVHDLSEFWD